MKIPRPEPGLVIRYGFLWRRDAEAGLENPTKARPAAIIAAVENVAGTTVVTVVPITHSPPVRAGQSIELSADVKRLLGLDSERSWIVTDELNSFAWPGVDLEPIGSSSSSIVYSRLPRSILAATLRSVLGHVRAGRSRAIKRTE